MSRAGIHTPSSLTDQHNQSLSFAIAQFYRRPSLPEKSVFVFPQDDCPREFQIGILNKINEQRRANCYAPLFISKDATIKAQEWVSTNREPPVWEKNNLREYGQLAWGLWNEADLQNIEVAYTEPFETNGNYKRWGDAVRPYYTGDFFNRRFSEFEWEITKALGVGCSSYKHKGNDVSFYMAVFFPHPTEGPETVSTFSKFAVPSDSCPDYFRSELIQKFNRARRLSDYSPLKYSDDLDKLATEFAETKALMDNLSKFELANTGYLAWSQWWSPGNKFSFTVSVERLFGENWEEVRPVIDDDVASRLLTVEEWRRTKNIGVGCVTKQVADQNIVRLEIVVLFNDLFI